MALLALLRGGGDLASGVALRLARAGIQVIVAELPRPLAVRRLASFAQAIYDGQIEIEGITGRRVEGLDGVGAALARGQVPVLVDPDADIAAALQLDVLVDARMTKRPPQPQLHLARFVVGLGPGFTAGVDCHAVVETQRGPFLGREYWQGSAAADTGLPETVRGHQGDRVLRAPVAGMLETRVMIGSRVQAGQPLAAVDGHVLSAPFDGVLRGLLQNGLAVKQGEKIGDLDPRGDERLVRLASDKALAIGGGVLEAVLSRPELRAKLGEA